MAAALLRAVAPEGFHVDSAGVYEGWLDPFAEAVMQEIGVTLEDHEPKAMKTLDLEKFDGIVALTPEAAGEARRFLPLERVELWEVANPSSERADRDEVMAAYRKARETLAERLEQRFDVDLRFAR